MSEASPGLAAHELPDLLALAQVQRRLEQVFPESFPERTMLVGVMAARVVFVFLYGDFVEANGRHLRPSYIYRFTEEQTAKRGSKDRLDWIASPNQPAGKPWYADNSRETIRDDLMRNRLLRMGIIGKRADVVVPVNSSKPIYFLSRSFADLFAPNLIGTALQHAVLQWRQAKLGKATLQRMALTAQGALKGATELLVDMPDGTRLRMAGGPSALIVKALIEAFAPAALQRPAVLWVSASDKKSVPAFVELAATVGLRFDLNADLPDLILADLADPMRIVFCEVVATDGAITAARKAALMAIVERSDLPLEVVHFLTAFEDRSSAPFRKNFSLLAPGSDVWFRTEPDLIVQIRPLSGR